MHLYRFVIEGLTPMRRLLREMLPGLAAPGPLRVGVPGVGNYLGIFDIAKNNESLQDVQHHTHGGIQTQPISFAFQLTFV